MITVTLIDNERFEYTYLIRFSLVVPLSFAEELTPFHVTAGIASSTELPNVLKIHDHQLKRIEFIADIDLLSDQLAYNEHTHMIDYVPSAIDYLEHEYFEGLNFV